MTPPRLRRTGSRRFPRCLRSRAIVLLALVAGLAGAAGVDRGWAGPVVDTNQTRCYSASQMITCPPAGQPFYGQDSQFSGVQPFYQDNGDGTVTDLRTGLMWQKGIVRNITWANAVAGASSFRLGGYSDWRLPTIKELYSLMEFSGWCGTDSTSSNPFIDRSYFTFYYGAPPRRYIDSQEWSSTSCVGVIMNGDPAAYGVNFADGRIKGYGKSSSWMVARYVRGTAYGANEFLDNGDGTITDRATDLIWSKTDSGTALNWEGALAWVQSQNAANYLGHSDWRLPDAKELQSIVDYTRDPGATDPTKRSPAIDPIFQTTSIGGDEYPFFWASTTHVDGPSGVQYTKAVYVCFGRALGWMEQPPGSGNWVLLNVHGAGAQRSDPKSGNPADWPHGNGPQGDVVRIYNYVRIVRGTSGSASIDHGNPQDGSLSGSALRAWPNPLTGATTIEFVPPGSGAMRLAIHDVVGREVALLFDGEADGASRRIDWDGSDSSGRLAPAGLYLARLVTANGARSLKLIRVP